MKRHAGLLFLGGVNAIDDIEDDEERQMTWAVAMDLAGDDGRLLPLKPADLDRQLASLFRQRASR